tara:strand:- start:4313 stop:4570 length:258 start_codon:yes stop_codon:yes gene_type:complete
MNSKKGMAGTTIITIVGTIAIVLILLLFVFGSSIIKKLDNASKDISILKEDKIGLNEIFSYMDEYKDLVELRFSESSDLSNWGER